MEKNIKRYTVTTVLEYDKDGDVIREEKCEDTEYFEMCDGPKTTYTPSDGYFAYPTNPIQYPYNPPHGTYCDIDPALRQPAATFTGSDPVMYRPVTGEPLL